MFDLDLNRFKARPPLKDVSFYVALFASTAILLPLLEQLYRERSMSVAEAIIAAAGALPISVYLRQHGYLRAAGVSAAGVAAGRAAFVAGPVTLDHEEIAHVPTEDDPDKMPRDYLGCALDPGTHTDKRRQGS